MEDSFYWACAKSGPAGNRFIVERGKDELWVRVKNEFPEGANCYWDNVATSAIDTQLEDVVCLQLWAVPTYQINQNRFVLEAAKIPVYAQFLKGCGNLSRFVSNPINGQHPIIQEPYDAKTYLKLVRLVNETLGIENDD